MADDRLAHAVDVVARRAAWSALESAVELEHVEWADYPEIGELDWERITGRLREIAEAAKPTQEEYAAAYDFLKGRAS